MRLGYRKPRNYVKQDKCVKDQPEDAHQLVDLGIPWKQRLPCRHLHHNAPNCAIPVYRVNRQPPQGKAAGNTNTMKGTNTEQTPLKQPSLHSFFKKENLSRSDEMFNPCLSIAYYVTDSQIRLTVLKNDRSRLELGSI
jgi:hypothetical protein